MPDNARGTRSRVLGLCFGTLALVTTACCGSIASAGPPAARDPQPVAPPPASEEIDVGALYHRTIQDFCPQDMGPAAVVEYFAPGALDVDEGGVLLYPGLAHHTSSNNHKLGVINTQQSYQMVVSWQRPGVGLPVSEVTVYTAGLHALPYRDFVAAHDLPAEAEWTQAGPMSDIVHRHVVRCGDRTLDVLLHEAVWSGDAVGKLTQFTLRRPSGDDPPVDPLDAALQATVPAIRECMDGEAPGGFVTAAFRLTPDGTVTDLQPTEKGADHPGLDDCVAAQLATIRIEPCDLQQPKQMEYWLSFFN